MEETEKIEATIIKQGTIKDCENEAKKQRNMKVIKKEGPTRVAEVYSVLRERINNKENNLKSTSISGTEPTPELPNNSNCLNQKQQEQGSTNASTTTDVFSSTIETNSKLSPNNQPELTAQTPPELPINSNSLNQKQQEQESTNASTTTDVFSSTIETNSKLSPNNQADLKHEVNKNLEFQYSKYENSSDLNACEQNYKKVECDSSISLNATNKNKKRHMPMSQSAFCKNNFSYFSPMMHCATNL